MKALATVRKLKLPDVQVNIAEKQVNIGKAELRTGTREQGRG